MCLTPINESKNELDQAGDITIGMKMGSKLPQIESKTEMKNLRQEILNIAGSADPKKVKEALKNWVDIRMDVEDMGVQLHNIDVKDSLSKDDYIKLLACLRMALVYVKICDYYKAIQQFGEFTESDDDEDETLHENIKRCSQILGSPILNYQEYKRLLESKKFSNS